MARGHAPKREAKKPKKKDSKKPALAVQEAFSSSGEVELVGKKRKAKEEEEDF